MARGATPAPVKLDPARPSKALAEAGVGLLVVDTPPGQPAFIWDLFGRADVVLVPVRPPPDDVLAAAPIAASLAAHPRWAVALS